MEMSTTKIFLVIAITIFLEDTKVLGRGVGKIRAEKWEHGKGKIKGMKNPMEKLGDNIGDHLDNARKAPEEVIHKEKLKGMKELGGNMGDIPVYGARHLGTARKALKVIHEGKLKGMRKPGGNMGDVPVHGIDHLGNVWRAPETVIHKGKLKGMEKLGGNMGNVPKFGFGHFGNAWRAPEKAIHKGKLKGMKKLGGNMGDVPMYGAGHLGNSQKAPEVIHKEKLKGRKNFGGKIGGIPVYKAGYVGDFVGAAPVLGGNGRMGKEQKWKGVKPGGKIRGAGHLGNRLKPAIGHRGDALKAVQEVFHAPRYE